MKKSKSKNKKNVRSGFLVFMAALVLGTMGIVLYLIRGAGEGGKSNVTCSGTTPGDCPSGFDCTQDASTGKYKCVVQSCTNNPNLCQNGSKCRAGQCICTGPFTGEFCDQVIPKGDCNTDTCELPTCIINNQYTSIQGFTPGAKMASAGGCVNLKKFANGPACDDSPECVDQAKQRCDRTLGCKSFYYYGTKGAADNKGRWCPKVEFDPDTDKNKGKTDTKIYGNFYYIDNNNVQNSCICAVGFQNHPEDTDKKLCTQCVDKRGPSRRVDANTPAKDCSMKLFGYKADGFSNTKFALQCQNSKDTTLKNICKSNYGNNATFAGDDDNCRPDKCFFTNWTYKCNVPAYWSDPSHSPTTFDSCKIVNAANGKTDAFPKWSNGTPGKAFAPYNLNLEDGHVPPNYATGGN